METVLALAADSIARALDNLAGRVTGPMRFRLILQPLLAIFFAARSGFRDAKAGRRPYFWAIVTEAGHRRGLLSEEWRDVGRIFVLAVLIDVVYQIVVARWVYPVEAVVVAVVLAFVPYLAFRGLVTRVVRHTSEPQAHNRRPA